MANDAAERVRWLRPHEAAERWGIHRSLVWTYAQRYGVRYRVMPSGERRYHPDDVEKLGCRIDSGEFGEQD